MASVHNTAFLAIVLVIISENGIIGPNEDELRASVSVEEQRAYIKISVLLGKTAIQIHGELVTALGQRSYSLRRVRELAKEFQSLSRLSCEDMPRSGRPHTSDTEINRERLSGLMSQNRAWRIDDLVEELDISHGSVWQLLHDMGYRKIASKYVPHYLTCQQKQIRVDACNRNLERYKNDPTLLHRIVAIDETWFRSFDPKDPQSAAEWRLPTEKRYNSI